VSGVAIITEACIDVKDRACVDVCPVQCIYEFDSENRSSKTKYNSEDQNKRHDHTFFIQLSRDVFGD
jgi:NAD-dependent dihydropyrimidine dehydrogenase PreA subunit